MENQEGPEGNKKEAPGHFVGGGRLADFGSPFSFEEPLTVIYVPFGGLDNLNIPVTVMVTDFL
jgi:hypothetical protein